MNATAAIGARTTGCARSCPETHCVDDDIARACCHCASDVQVKPWHVQISLSVASTTDDKEELRQETNLAHCGGTCRSFAVTCVTPATVVHLRGAVQTTVSGGCRRTS